MKFFTVSSNKRQDIIDITKEVTKIIDGSKIEAGICLVYTPHSSGAIIVNENYDPNIMLDIIEALNDFAPQGKWRHDKVDGNGDAHIKASIIGPSETLVINKGKINLGKWQNIMFAEFDGPRTRKVIVKIIAG